MAEPLELTLTHEAWYHVGAFRKTSTQTGREAHLQCIRADAESSYCTFEEHQIGARLTVTLSFYSDGWKILADHPSLFARLAARLADGCTLEQITALILEYGATDVTPRANPHAHSTNPKD